MYNILKFNKLRVKMALFNSLVYLINLFRFQTTIFNKGMYVQNKLLEKALRQSIYPNSL